MQAVVCGGIDIFNFIQDLDIPELAAGHVLIEIAYAGVSDFDFVGESTQVPFPSFVPGISGVGQVVDAAYGVNFISGDIVFFCLPPRKTVDKGGPIAALGGGSYANFMAVPASACALAPRGISLSLLSSIVVPGLLALSCISAFEGVSARSSVLIHAGAFGGCFSNVDQWTRFEHAAIYDSKPVVGAAVSLLVQFCRAIGAMVYVATPPATQLYALALGADVFVDPIGHSFVNMLAGAEVTGVDFVFDFIGGKYYKQSFASVKRGGVVMSFVESPDEELAASRNVRVGSISLENMRTGEALGQLTRRMVAMSISSSLPGGAGSGLHQWKRIGGAATGVVLWNCIELPLSAVKEARRLLQDRSSGVVFGVALRATPAALSLDARLRVGTSAAVRVPDELRPQCALCRRAFTLLTRRRHHCRTCGEVVCLECSIKVHTIELSVGHNPAPSSRTAVSEMSDAAIRQDRSIKAVLAGGAEGCGGVETHGDGGGGSGGGGNIGGFGGRKEAKTQAHIDIRTSAAASSTPLRERVTLPRGAALPNFDGEAVGARVRLCMHCRRLQLKREQLSLPGSFSSRRSSSALLTGGREGAEGMGDLVGGASYKGADAQLNELSEQSSVVPGSGDTRAVAAPPVASNPMLARTRRRLELQGVSVAASPLRDSPAAADTHFRGAFLSVSSEGNESPCAPDDGACAATSDVPAEEKGAAATLVLDLPADRPMSSSVSGEMLPPVPSQVLALHGVASSSKPPIASVEQVQVDVESVASTSGAPTLVDVLPLQRPGDGAPDGTTSDLSPAPPAFVSNATSAAAAAAAEEARLLSALTQAQLEALRVFASRVTGSGLLGRAEQVEAWRPTAGSASTCLLRFLRARAFDVDAAEILLREDVEWRASFGGPGGVPALRRRSPAEILGADPAEVQTNFFSQKYHGWDREGRPVFFISVAGMNASRLFKLTDRPRLLAFHVWKSERMLDILELRARLSHRPIEAWSIVIDGRGASVMQFGREMLRTIAALTAVDQAHYVERVRKIYIVNVPAAASLVWSLVKPILGKATLDKLDMVGAGEGALLDTLAVDFDLSLLPWAYSKRCRLHAAPPQGACLDITRAGTTGFELSVEEERAEQEHARGLKDIASNAIQTVPSTSGCDNLFSEVGGSSQLLYRSSDGDYGCNIGGSEASYELIASGRPEAADGGAESTDEGFTAASSFIRLGSPKEELNLGFIALPNGIPRELAELWGPHVTTLNLAETALGMSDGNTGIKQAASFDAKVANLALFRRVHTLVLDQNGLMDLRSFPPMPYLRTLWFNNNAVANLDFFLSQVAALFPRLAHLSLMGNPGVPVIFDSDSGDSDNDSDGDSDGDHRRYAVSGFGANIKLNWQNTFSDSGSSRLAVQEQNHAQTRARQRRFSRHAYRIAVLRMLPRLLSLDAAPITPSEMAEVVFVEATWENERYDPFLFRWRPPFLPTDRYHWSGRDGSQHRPRGGFKLPSEEWEWLSEWEVQPTVEVSLGDDSGGTSWVNRESSASPLSDVVTVSQPSVLLRSGLNKTLASTSADLNGGFPHSPSYSGAATAVAESLTGELSANPASTRERRTPSLLDGGWEYANDFPTFSGRGYRTLDVVRRRCWVRTRVLRPRTPPDPASLLLLAATAVDTAERNLPSVDDIGGIGASAGTPAIPRPVPTLSTAPPYLIARPDPLPPATLTVRALVVSPFSRAPSDVFGSTGSETSAIMVSSAGVVHNYGSSNAAILLPWSHAYGPPPVRVKLVETEHGLGPDMSVGSVTATAGLQSLLQPVVVEPVVDALNVFATASLGAETFRTMTVNRSLTPVFNAEFRFELSTHRLPTLQPWQLMRDAGIDNGGNANGLISASHNLLSDSGPSLRISLWGRTPERTRNGEGYEKVGFAELPLSHVRLSRPLDSLPSSVVVGSSPSEVRSAASSELAAPSNGNSDLDVENNGFHDVVLNLELLGSWRSAQRTRGKIKLSIRFSRPDVNWALSEWQARSSLSPNRLLALQQHQQELLVRHHSIPVRRQVASDFVTGDTHIDAPVEHELSLEQSEQEESRNVRDCERVQWQDHIRENTISQVVAASSVSKPLAVKEIPEATTRMLQEPYNSGDLNYFVTFSTALVSSALKNLSCILWTTAADRGAIFRLISSNKVSLGSGRWKSNIWGDLAGEDAPSISGQLFGSILGLLLANFVLAVFLLSFLHDS